MVMETKRIYQLDSDGEVRISAVDKVSLTPPYVHLRRTMGEYVLYFMLSGEMELVEGEQPVTLRANDVYIFDPGVEHYGTKAVECSYFYIHFSHDAMQADEMENEQLKNYMIERRLHSMKEGSSCQACERKKHMMIPKHFHINDPGGALTLLDILQRIRFSHYNHQEFYQKNTEAVFLEFLIAYVREFTNGYLMGNHSAVTKRSICMIYDLLAYFQDNYAFDFTSNWIEERYQRSYDHLNRTFKKMVGTTIFSYLNGVRISHAKQLLQAGTGTMAEIADKCGFHDIYYFSRVFKKYTGTTPGTVYRRT